MRKLNDLRLHEKAMLLIIKDQEGTIGVSMWQYALGGAILAELFLEERLQTAGKKKEDVTVANPKHLGDPLLDECLDLVKDSAKTRSSQHWVSKFAGIKDLHGRVASGLARRGILRADEDKVLLFFTRKIYPELDPRPERELVELLEQAIFGDAEDLDPHTAVLVGLGHKTGLLNATFPPKRLKTRKDRMDAIAQGEFAGAAAGKALASAQAAIFVSCIIVPTIITN